MSLFLIQHHETKAYGRVEVWLYEILISALISNDCSTSRSGRYIPRERALGAQCIGVWMCSRAAVVTVQVRSLPRQILNTDPYVVTCITQSLIQCEDNG
jgi:hypothetical protein